MVVSLHDITVGDDIELKRILASAGFDGELAKALLRKPQLAEPWVRNLREQLKPPAPTLGRLFRLPEQIYSDFVDMNGTRNWGFTMQDLTKLRRTMPADFTSRLDSVLTLDIWLGDLPTTLEELWAWNLAVHGANGTWRRPDLKSDKKHLRLLDSKRYGNQPSVKWVVLDLTANWDKQNGIRPRDVRDPANSAGLQVLSAAALHPEWPPAINYVTIPGVWLPGLQASVPGYGPWSDVPILGWDQFDRKVDLDAGWDGGRSSDFAVPVFREL